VKVKEFKKWLNTCSQKSLILINGPEDYFKVAIKACIQDSSENADCFYYSSDEISVEKASDIISDASTIPFLCEKKIYYIRDVDKLPAKIQSIFSGFFSDLPYFTLFILSATSLDGRTSFFKKIKKYGKIFNAATPYKNECVEWIDYLLERNDVKMDVEGKNLLIELVGTSLISIESEIKKITSYVEGRETISAEDILAVTGHIKINSIFELTDAIGCCDCVTALYLLKNLTDQGVNEIVILTMIARHFRFLLRIQDMKRRDIPRSQIQTVLKINPCFLDGYFRQASHISSSRIFDFYKKIFETDVALKSINRNPEAIAESLILSLSSTSTTAINC